MRVADILADIPCDARAKCPAAGAVKNGVYTTNYPTELQYLVRPRVFFLSNSNLVDHVY